MANTTISIRIILPVFKEHNEKMYKLIGNGYKYGTCERFETAYDHTKAFLKDVYKVDDFDITKFDQEFIEKYEFWLTTVRKCNHNHNTTMKYLGNFKKIVLMCVKRKWIQQDPFGELKMTKKIKKLKRSDIFIGIYGYRWIDNERVKTDGAAPIPLLPIAEQLMDKYDSDPECIKKGLVFPVRSNQKMNAYLKEIIDLCGIHIQLTFHIARHTFATTICLTNGISMETTSKLLCHASIMMTAGVYAQIVDRKVSSEMMTISDKYRFMPLLCPDTIQLGTTQPCVVNTFTIKKFSHASYPGIHIIVAWELLMLKPVVPKLLSLRLISK